MTTRLTARELDHANVTAARLCAEVRAWLDQLPLEAQSISGMSRYLNVDRNLCQRLFSLIRHPAPTAGALLGLPGVDGMEILFRSAALKGAGTPETIEALTSAATQYARLVREVGPNQSKLNARIRETLSGESASENGPSVDAGAGLSVDAQDRRTMFESSARLARCSLEAFCTVDVLRRDATAPDMLTGAMGHVHVGWRSDDNIPLTSRTYMLSGKGENHAWDKQATVVRQYSTTPVIEADLCSSPNVHIIDRTINGRLFRIAEDRDSGAPVSDLAASNPMAPFPNPLCDSFPYYSAISRARRPMRRLIIDLYIDRDACDDLAFEACGVFGRVGGQTNLESIFTGNMSWDERLPGGTTIVPLPPNDPVSASMPMGSDCWRYHAELVRRTFVKAQTTPDRCVGYRLDVPYPFWGATYILSARFGTGVIRTDDLK